VARSAQGGGIHVGFLHHQRRPKRPPAGPTVPPAWGPARRGPPGERFHRVAAGGGRTRGTGCRSRSGRGSAQKRDTPALSHTKVGFASPTRRAPTTGCGERCGRDRQRTPLGHGISPDRSGDSPPRRTPRSVPESRGPEGPGPRVRPDLGTAWQTRRVTTVRWPAIRTQAGRPSNVCQGARTHGRGCFGNRLETRGQLGPRAGGRRWRNVLPGREGELARSIARIRRSRPPRTGPAPEFSGGGQGRSAPLPAPPRAGLRLKGASVRDPWEQQPAARHPCRTWLFNGGPPHSWVARLSRRVRGHCP